MRNADRERLIDRREDIANGLPDEHRAPPVGRRHRGHASGAAQAQAYAPTLDKRATVKAAPTTGTSGRLGGESDSSRRGRRSDGGLPRAAFGDVDDADQDERRNQPCTR